MAGKNNNDLQMEEICRSLVDDIATPLATLQLNLQALTTYLPRLVEAYRKNAAPPADLSPISPDHLAALSRLPAAMEGDIRRLRELVQAFLVDITPRHAEPAGIAEEPPAGQAALAISRILLVEDEEVHQQITLKQIAGKYHVDMARTGAEAMQMCNERAYDLVLLDFILPGMDGRSLISSIRQSKSSETTILALSNMPIKASEYRELGINGFLEKPFRIKNFDEALAGLDKTRDRNGKKR